jgi:serralysin
MNLLEGYFSEYQDLFAAPAPARPSVAVADVTVGEAVGSMVFTIVRSGDLSLASSVNYSTANGSATAGSDYSAANGTISFAPGQATATVAVNVINDSLVENPETLTLNLSGGTNVAIADGVANGTINSDDVLAPLSSPGTMFGTEAGETINGTGGNDIINGLGGNDVLNGLAGVDWLTGGAGSDRFVFDSAANANGDVVTDFVAGVDKLDFRSLDGDAGRKGTQKLTWIDSGEFTGRAGQLREFDLDGKHFVAGDTNGDRLPDFVIEVAGTFNLTANDFFL